MVYWSMFNNWLSKKNPALICSTVFANSRAINISTMADFKLQPKVAEHRVGKHHHHVILPPQTMDTMDVHNLKSTDKSKM